MAKTGFVELPDKDYCLTFSEISTRAQQFAKYFQCQTKVVATKGRRDTQSQLEWVVLVPDTHYTAWAYHMKMDEEKFNRDYMEAMEGLDNMDSDSPRPEFELSGEYEPSDPWEDQYDDEEDDLGGGLVDDDE